MLSPLVLVTVNVAVVAVVAAKSGSTAVAPLKSSKLGPLGVYVIGVDGRLITGASLTATTDTVRLRTTLFALDASANLTDSTRGVVDNASELLENPINPIAAWMRAMFAVNDKTNGVVPFPPVHVAILTPFARSSLPTTE